MVLANRTRVYFARARAQGYVNERVRATRGNARRARARTPARRHQPRRRSCNVGRWVSCQLRQRFAKLLAIVSEACRRFNAIRDSLHAFVVTHAKRRTAQIPRGGRTTLKLRGGIPDPGGGVTCEINCGIKLDYRARARNNRYLVTVRLGAD